jgi:hypothetical protein
VAGASNRVRLDLNSPEFQDVLFRLEENELKQVIGALRRLRQLEWATLYQHRGFHWEAIRHIKTPNNSSAYSLRLSQKIRAIAYRDGQYLRLLSLHPDHDSAYRS